MGNYASCTSFTRPHFIRETRSRELKVVLPGGEICLFRGPITAAELMLECPGFFVVNSLALYIGRRFSPLGADEELEYGNVYFMFPMKRASSMVTAADMAAVYTASRLASKQISSAKVVALPDEMSTREATATSSGRSERGDVVAEGFLLAAAAAPEFLCRLSSCRSKKPSLETIKEEAWTMMDYSFRFLSTCHSPFCLIIFTSELPLRVFIFFSQEIIPITLSWFFSSRLCENCKISDLNYKRLKELKLLTISHLKNI